MVFRFALPSEAVDGRLLQQAPTVEIYRAFESQPTPSPKSAANSTLVLTIPSEMLDHYVQAGRVRYAEPLEASDFAPQPDEVAVYTVRTRVSPKADSADSNAVSLHLHPAAIPITDLKAEITRPAIVLTWAPPQATIAGPLPSGLTYRIYRAEIEPAAAGAAESAPNPPPPPSFVKIGETDAPPFSDTETVFGATYEYSVRSVLQYGGGPIESADSNLITVARKDIFPPAAPTGLVVVFVPGQGTTHAHLELSWAISPETDIAGYNVYRSDEAGVQGARQNTELLISPAFRDMKVEPGRRYFYSVTAVDRSGNESPASAVGSGGVPAEGQPTP